MTKSQPDTILVPYEASSSNEVQFNLTTSKVNNGINTISKKEFKKVSKAVKKNARKTRNKKNNP